MKSKHAYVSVFGMCLCVAAGAVVPVSAAPRVVCPSPTFDFGTRKDADAVEHSFVLENHGDEVLTFGRIRACCGATASLRAGSVAPGTNTQFDVKLSLRGRRGTVNKSLYVATNDPRTPQLMLQLTGQVESSSGNASLLANGSGVARAVQPHQVASVERDIVVVPLSLTLVQTDVPNPVTRYVALRSRSQTPFEIKDISLPAEAVVKSLAPLGKAGWRIEIDNLVPSVQLEGTTVTFISDHTSEPSISIPIHVVAPRTGGMPAQ